MNVPITDGAGKVGSDACKAANQAWRHPIVFGGRGLVSRIGRCRVGHPNFLITGACHTLVALIRKYLINPEAIEAR